MEAVGVKGVDLGDGGPMKATPSAQERAAKRLSASTGDGGPMKATPSAQERAAKRLSATPGDGGPMKATPSAQERAAKRLSATSPFAVGRLGALRHVGKTWQRKAQAAAFVKGVRQKSASLLDADGSIILEPPSHPARLTPVRQMSAEVDETLAGSASPEIRVPVASPSQSGRTSGPSGGGEGVVATPEQGQHGPILRRTFSRKCYTVLRDQRTVKEFDALRGCLECSFFKPCSSAFMRELVMSGGKQLWQGEYYDSGTVLYSQGEASTSMYIVCRGVAESFFKDRTREPKEHKPGGFFGAVQVLGVLSRRHESVRAKTPLHVLVVSALILSRLLKRTKEEDEAIEAQHDDDGDDLSMRPLLAEQSSSEQIGSPTSIGAGSPVRKTRSGNIPTYVFLEERRHFEREAVRLYLELGVPRKGRRPRATSAGVSVASGGPPLRPRRKQEEEGTAEAIVETSDERVTSPAKGRREAWSRLSSDSSVGKGVVEDAQIQDEAAAIAAQERFMQRLVASIRGDMRRGYMMPADAVLSDDNTSRKRTPRHAGGARGSNRSPVPRSPTKQGHSNFSDAQVLGTGSRLSDSSVVANSRFSSATEDDEDCAGDDIAPVEFDLQMLPPIALMGTIQKYSLLKQLQEQARAYRKKRRVTTKNRFGNPLSAEKPSDPSMLERSFFSDQGAPLGSAPNGSSAAPASERVLPLGHVSRLSTAAPTSSDATTVPSTASTVGRPVSANFPPNGCSPGMMSPFGLDMVDEEAEEDAFATSNATSGELAYSSESRRPRPPQKAPVQSPVDKGSRRTTVP